MPVRPRSPAPIQYRGVEQLVARRAHNPEVAGSSPVSATIRKPWDLTIPRLSFLAFSGSLPFESEKDILWKEWLIKVSKCAKIIYVWFCTVGRFRKQWAPIVLLYIIEQNGGCLFVRETAEGAGLQNAGRSVLAGNSCTNREQRALRHRERKKSQ